MPWSRSLSSAAVAAALACAGNPSPAAPAAAPLGPAVSTAPEPVSPALPPTLSDARVLELGRAHAALLDAREYERLWPRLTPEAQARLGTLASFRIWGDQSLDGLGGEQQVIRESAELPREGMRADRLYVRISRHAHVSARLVIGLRNDGSIVGMQLRRAD